MHNSRLGLELRFKPGSKPNSQRRPRFRPVRRLDRAETRDQERERRHQQRLQEDREREQQWSPADIRCIAVFSSCTAFASLASLEPARTDHWTPADTDQWLALSGNALGALAAQLGVPEAQRAGLVAHEQALSRERMKKHQQPPSAFSRPARGSQSLLEPMGTSFPDQMDAVAQVLRPAHQTPCNCSPLLLIPGADEQAQRPCAAFCPSCSQRALGPQDKDPASVGDLRGDDLSAWIYKVSTAAWLFLDAKTPLLATNHRLMEDLVNKTRFLAITFRGRVPPPAPPPAPSAAPDLIPVPPAGPPPPPPPSPPPPQRRRNRRRKKTGSRTAVVEGSTWYVTGVEPQWYSFNAKTRRGIRKVKADLDYINRDS